jgi:hypothetical protein
MQSRYFIRIFAILLLPLAVLFTSCEGEHLCAGLNNGTGSANNSKSVRKKNRGGYKSPRELDARDRQKKRIKNHQRKSGRKSRGGGNTSGRRNFGGGFSFSTGRNGKAKASGSVKY